MNVNFWQGKKVLVTGHTGFKGSWLSLYLHSMGAEIIGYSLPPPTDPSLHRVARIDEVVKTYLGDIRDFETLYQVIQDEKPEVVFHLAAQSLVKFSYTNPVETYATNVMGTVHLLEALRLINCARVAIIVTSDKCYENREWCWPYRETEPLGGFDPYSSSKGCAELVTSAYHNSYFSNEKDNATLIASVRAGNVIGGGDWAQNRLIPDFIRAIEANTPLKIRYPNAIRPWQHVLEPLSGYLLLAQRLWEEGRMFAGAWNFGPSEEDAKSVEWIITEIAQHWGSFKNVELDNKAHPHEASTLKLDISKARSRLQWNPRWPIAKSLVYVVDWYKAYQKNKDMKEFTVKQINKYQQLLTVGSPIDNPVYM